MMSGKSGTVALFLRNLPPNVNCKDLKSFVQRGLQTEGVVGLPLFNLCSNCRILRITDLATGTTQYHGLVEVKPARIAMQAIQVLSRREIRETAIEVRRYRHRSTWGEHWHRADELQIGTLVLRPLTERRRANVKIDLVESTPMTGEYEGEPALST